MVKLDNDVVIVEKVKGEVWDLRAKYNKEELPISKYKIKRRIINKVFDIFRF